MDEQLPVTPSEPELSAEAKQWAMLTHLAAFAAFLIPFGNIIGPLLVWQLKKDLGPFVEQNGKEAVNFQITVAIVSLVCIMLIFVVIGALLLPVLGLVWLILTIIAGVKANDGVAYRYPLTIRFLK
ncbi:DUF4870 domain-containing protein [Denitrificimonas caeni]|uniref:DUF4870 domain-containing protein n=1 Tax=Denitrificimonas caeni TaxID=521720 RepID=UPI0019624E18|nr:DUF4870 domain-containing protein [Denitrificimonas caeni]